MQRACLCTVYTRTENLPDQGATTLMCACLWLRSMSVNQIHLTTKPSNWITEEFIGNTWHSELEPTYLLNLLKLDTLPPNKAPRVYISVIAVLSYKIHLLCNPNWQCGSGERIFKGGEPCLREYCFGTHTSQSRGHTSKTQTSPQGVVYKETEYCFRVCLLVSFQRKSMFGMKGGSLF